MSGQLAPWKLFKAPSEGFSFSCYSLSLGNLIHACTFLHLYLYLYLHLYLYLYLIHKSFFSRRLLSIPNWYISPSTWLLYLDVSKTFQSHHVQHCPALIPSLAVFCSDRWQYPSSCTHYTSRSFLDSSLALHPIINPVLSPTSHLLILLSISKSTLWLSLAWTNIIALTNLLHPVFPFLPSICSPLQSIEIFSKLKSGHITTSTVD